MDAKSAFDAVQKGDTASAAFGLKEKYSALELLAVVENLRLQKTPLLWVSSDAQLSDGLTKPAAQDHLKNFLMRGQQWNVKYDLQFLLAAKKKPKSERMMQSAPETSPMPADWALSVVQMLQQAHTSFGNSLWGV